MSNSTTNWPTFTISSGTMNYGTTSTETTEVRFRPQKMITPQTKKSIRNLRAGDTFYITDKDGTSVRIRTIRSVCYCSMCDVELSKCTKFEEHRDKYALFYMLFDNQKDERITDLDLVVLLGLTPLTESLVDKKKFLDTEVEIIDTMSTEWYEWDYSDTLIKYNY